MELSRTDKIGEILASKTLEDTSAGGVNYSWFLLGLTTAIICLGERGCGSK